MMAIIHTIRQLGVIEKRGLPALDGVRGFAFLLVLLAHFSNHYAGPFKGLGKVGVWIFFVLSAFLLTEKFLREPNTALSRDNLANFACRRFFRIIPLYLITLFIYVPFNYVVTENNLFDHLTFQVGEGHLWTVVVELKYYLLLPFLTIILLRLLKAPLIAAVLFMVCLWAMSVVVFPPSAFPVSSISLTAYLNVFLAGSIGAFLFVRLGGVSLGTANFLTVAAVLVLAATTPSVWSALFETVRGDHFYRAYPMFALVAVALIFSAASPGSWAERLFSTVPLQLLGKISFSGYLIHPLVLRLTSGYAKDIGTPVAVVTSATIVLIVSCAIYVSIERPLSNIQLAPRRAPRFTS